MLKKMGILAISSAILFGAAYFFLLPNDPIYNPNGYCAFCNQEVITRQKFYEDDLVVALYTHKPILQGHCLIIPKRHVERFEMLSDEEILQISRVIKKIDITASRVFGASSYLLLQKNGSEVGQTVPHVHFHYIPRPIGDSSTLKFLFRFYAANHESPLPPAEMQAIVEKMKAAMN